MSLQVSKSIIFNWNRQGSFHTAFKYIIILAQCFALFPVHGIRSSNSDKLRFSWKSYKVLYSCLFITSMLILTLISTYQLITTAIINSKKISNIIFFLSAGINAILFLRLAKAWPNLVLSWEKMEKKIVTKSEYDVNLKIKFKVICTVIMTLALIEHVLSIMSSYTRAFQCARFNENTSITKIYFVLKFPELFSTENYALWKAIVIKFVNFLGTFSWTFIDLFLTLISVSITEQFKRFNQRLYSRADREMPDKWWTESRIYFNYLATITRMIDSKISMIVLLSFSVNIYFICIQLLNSFNPMPNVIHRIYFCFSFGFLLLRTAMVSLSAANIHEESLLPAPVLYNVETKNYSTEVQRFLLQVTTDNISITGMKFFSVTRSLILTLVGTIVTYELVLVQFNSIQDDQPEDRFDLTKQCILK